MATDAALALIPASTLPDEERRSRGRAVESFPALLARLSRQSVVKHFDAYADIDWDAAESRIDPDDPRWTWGDDDVLGATAWYRAQPEGVRARIGLHMIATFMKLGVQFEGVLKRGLLEFASRLPNGSPEFRYVYHEVIEEAQHSLMFQEFVNRTGFDIRGLPAHEERMSRVVVSLGRRFPELFFVFVLGGEDPIDYVQRKAVRSGRPIHPSAPAAHHPDPRHRGGAPPLLRAGVPPPPGDGARTAPSAPARDRRAAHPGAHGAAHDAPVAADRPRVWHPARRDRRGLHPEPAPSPEHHGGAPEGPGPVRGARDRDAGLGAALAGAPAGGRGVRVRLSRARRWRPWRCDRLPASTPWCEPCPPVRAGRGG